MIPPRYYKNVIDRVVAGDIDLIDTQDQLIDAGFPKQARL